MDRRAFLRSSGVVGAAAALSQPAIASRSRPALAQEQAGDGYEPRGQVPVDNAAEAVVGADGETAYLAVGTGFATVDISDPAEPEVLAEERGLEVGDDRVTEALDVAVDGDRLVVPGPANAYGDSAPVFHGFLHYDVTDPADPVAVGDPYETGYHIHNCYLEDELLFVVGNTEDDTWLDIFAIDDGVETVGRWSLLDHAPEWGEIDWIARYLHDVYVQHDVAYLPHWNAGTYLLDVSDPSEPTVVSRVADTDLEEQREIGSTRDARQGLPGNDHYAAVDDSGDLMAVGREAWSTGGDDPDHPGGIDLYDITDPTEPEHRGTIDAPRAEDETYAGGMWTTSHNFELRDGQLYSSWYRAGVKIHDVSDPSEPDELAAWRDADNAGVWTARVADPGETFVASSTPVIPNSPTSGALYTFPIVDNPDDSSGADEDGSAVADSIPGFTGLAGLAGGTGAVALEWLSNRRPRDAE